MMIVTIRNFRPFTVSAKRVRLDTLNVVIDIAKALYPLLNLKWGYEWTLDNGLGHIEERIPDQRRMLRYYSEYVQLSLSSSCRGH